MCCFVGRSVEWYEVSHLMSDEVPRQLQQCAALSDFSQPLGSPAEAIEKLTSLMVWKRQSIHRACAALVWQQHSTACALVCLTPRRSIEQIPQ